MAPLTHEAMKSRSYAVLDTARQKASKSSGYDSSTFRATQTRVFHERCGYNPYTWQLDATESVHLGLDTIVVAGTGSGKTMPFIMPLLADPTKKVVIISPLKVLQNDHAERFRKLGISSVAVNGDTWSMELLKDLKAGRYQAILASPEMCLKHVAFRQFLKSGNFDNITAIYIDEAHCISQWGGDFRKSYGDLRKLRSFFPLEIPMYATTATLTPTVLREVQSSLQIDPTTSFYLNLGNDRPNISYEVHQMESATDFEALKPFLSRNDIPNTPDDLIKSIIFTNTVATAQYASRQIKTWLPEHLRGQVDYLHAHRSRRDKRRVMRRFRRGEIKILIATEAAGMGADIPDIEQVVQFGVPSSLSVWFQRAGRAGRSEGLNAQAVLLVEKSMFQKQKARTKKSAPAKTSAAPDPGEGGDDDDDDVVVVEDEDGKEYKKKVDPSLREWVETKFCRRDYADAYFFNPTTRQPPTHRCCDNCPRQDLLPSAMPLLFPNSSLSRPTTPSNDVPSSTHTTPSKSTNANGKRPLVQAPTTTSVNAPKRSRRTKEHLASAKEALRTWRSRTYQHTYSSAPFTSAIFLPDSVITTLASAKFIKTLDDMKQEVDWLFIDRHGEEILGVLLKLDTQRQEGIKATADAKKAATAARNAEKKRLEQAEKDRRQRKADELAEERERAVQMTKEDKENRARVAAAAREAAKPPPKRPRRDALQGSSVINFASSPATPAPSLSLFSTPTAPSPYTVPTIYNALCA